MGAKQQNLVGLVFNRLTVIEQVEPKKFSESYKRQWKCKCICGNTVISNTGALSSGNTQSCGCLHKETNVSNSRYSRHKLIQPASGFNAIYAAYKRNARNRNLIFSLTQEEARLLMVQPCFYCASLPNNIYKGHSVPFIYSGIDRVDNNKGYFLDNCVSCCSMCNHAKKNHTQEEFFSWVSKVYLTLNKEM